MCTLWGHFAFSSSGLISRGSGHCVSACIELECVCVRVCVRACVRACVCEREREKERERVQCVPVHFMTYFAWLLPILNYSKQFLSFVFNFYADTWRRGRGGGGGAFETLVESVFCSPETDRVRSQNKLPDFQKRPEHGLFSVHQKEIVFTHVHRKSVRSFTSGQLDTSPNNATVFSFFLSFCVPP